TAIVDDLGGVLVVDAFQRRREMIGVTFPPHLAVSDDVDAGTLHVADGQQGGIVLRLLQVWLLHAPQLAETRAGHAFGEQRTVDQPVGLRIGADDRRLQQSVGHHWALMPAAFTSSPFSLSSRTTRASNSAGDVG